MLTFLVFILMSFTMGILDNFGTDRFFMAVLAGLITLLLTYWTTFASFFRAINFAPEYAATAQCLTILVWFLPVVFLTNFFANTLGAIDEQTFVLKVTILSAVFNVVANLIFVPRYAQIGASVITVLTALLGLAFLIVKMGRKISSPISWAPLARVLLAGIAILPFLLWKPNIHVLVLLLGSILLYFGALLLFRALSIRDIKVLFTSLKPPTEI